MKEKKELKNRVYRLKRGAAPLSFMLPSKSSKRRPLLYFDEDTGENREIRYATNQPSPFKDEQDGNAIVRPIIFESGLLTVRKENQALQKFLAYHPLNGKKFEEVDTARDAAQEVADMNVEVDALIAAKQMTVDVMESVGRVLLQGDVNKMSTAELKRDLLVYARNYPAEFLQAIDDPALKLHSTIQKFFEERLITYRNKKKDVYFNLPSNKKRLLTIPFGEEPLRVMSAYFKTDEGVEKLEYLEKLLD